MKLFKLFVLLLFVSPVFAQTTNISGTVTDPDSLSWAKGTIQFAIYNPNGGTITSNGTPITSTQSNQVFTLNNSGVFSGSVLDNSLLQPVGTQWNMTVCPAASAPCQQLPRVTISGASQSLTSTINSQLKALRFPAGYTSRAYNAVEISPIPNTGATYFDLTLNFPLYWNGAAWVGFGSNTGITPHTPANSVQIANSDVSSFNSDPNILIDPITHTFKSNLNSHFASMESIPRVSYDPWDTKYAGGLAGALAGTSGHTVNEVLTATVDYGECQFKMGLAPAQQKILLPTGVTLPIAQVKLWSNQDFSGESLRSQPTFQHTDATKAMITGHSGSDTLTCSNSVTYTPGQGSAILIQNIGLSGMGSQTSPNDIGIMMNGQSWFVYNITGAGNSFGAQVILDNGFENFIYRAGYPSAQLEGCQSYVTGAVTGLCQSVQNSSHDSEMDYIYASDGAQFNSGHAAGPCYPGCAAIGINGSNVSASHLFGQISDIDIIVNGSSTRGVVWRLDGTSRESLRFGALGSASLLSDVVITSPCTDTALQSNYNAGIATGCAGIADLGQGNQISGIEVGGAGGVFGASFTECAVSSATNGSSAAGSTYGFMPFRGNPNNTSKNDRLYCGQFAGDQASGRVFLPSMAPMAANNAIADVSGLTSIVLATTTPLETLTGGVAGQEEFITGVSGSTVDVGGNIQTCTGLAEPGSNFPMHFKNMGGYNNGFGQDNNFWKEICNTPQNAFVHLAWTGNPIPTNPAVVDFYGNEIVRRRQPITLDVSQIHGPAAPSGQYCFVEEAIYADQSHVVSQLACTVVDLANQTPGEVFITASPQALTYNLYLVSNTTTSGIPTGKYPAPAGGQWGSAVLAAGGNLATPPTTSDNTTGMVFDQWGIVNNTTANTQPSCNIFTRGRQWMVSGGGVANDTFQICVQQAGGTYAWVTH